MIKINNVIKGNFISFFTIIVKTSILVLIFLAIAMYFDKVITINQKEVSVSSEDIKYYIDIADSNSKTSKQLNWKEIASAEKILNNKFDTYNKDNSNSIASKFYNSDGTMKDYKTFLKDLELSDDDILKAYQVLDQLNNESYSLRTLKIGKNNGKDDFIESLKEGSIENYKKYGVYPSIAISQAILESNWGDSDLASKYNNFYGIKADKSWKGEIATFKTGENYNDKIVANFRAYDSRTQSVEDFGQFLKNNKRYSESGVFSANNYKEQAQALENAGYSTVKDKDGKLIYADMLIDIIKENNLMIIDSEAQKTK